MGEVFRAHDTKLNRDVALKILPEQFASDSQRMARFQREAEVLASLDHPNIGQITASTLVWRVGLRAPTPYRRASDCASSSSASLLLSMLNLDRHFR